MLIDWVRAGQTGKYLALSQDMRTVRTSWHRAKWFLVRPSHSVDKYMLLTGWEVRIGKNCDRGLEIAARGLQVGLFTHLCHWIGLRAVYKPFIKNLTSERVSAGLFIRARSTGLARFPRSRLATLSLVKISTCSYEKPGWPGYRDLGFCDRDLGNRDENFPIWTLQPG